jgi:alanyl-tRNA synthetase
VSRGVRVEFVCGLRAVRSAREDFTILRETSALLSTRATELAPTVARLLTEGKTNAKQSQKLREELAVFQGTKLAMEEPIQNGLRLVVRAFRDRDRDYVKMLASQAAKAAPLTVAIFSANDADPAHVFVARSSDLGFNCGQILREALARVGLRGGGSADQAQGEVPAQQEAALRTSISEAIRKAVAEAHSQQ